MAWSSPMTATSGQILSASQFNSYIRDNLLETAPASATTAGALFAVSGGNSIAERRTMGNTVGTSESTTSTSFANLSTVGPQVTLNTGGQVLVGISAEMNNSLTGGASIMGVAVSGSSSILADSLKMVEIDGITASNNVRLGAVFGITGLTSGSNTFTCQYRVGSGTGTFANREIVVVPL